MILYASVESLRNSLGSSHSSYDTGRIVKVLGSASREVDNVVQRVTGFFRPVRKTLYFQWPPSQTSAYNRVWFDANGIISVTTLTAGGVVIPASNFFLEPQQYGPPYDRVEINIGSDSALSFDDTPQRALVVDGLWGNADDVEYTCTLSGAINDSTTSIVVSDGSSIGVGDYLIIGTERLDVINRFWNDSTQNIGAGLTASAANTSISVTTGSSFHAGEKVLVDSETMTIQNISGNTLTVKRAMEGSVLAAHTIGADIYVSRTFTVERGAYGSTSASHLDNTVINRHVVPSDVEELTIATATTYLLSGQSGYSREYGPQGSGTKLGVGIDELRNCVRENYGRQCRTRVV